MANVSAFTGAMPVIPGGLVELGYSQITTPVAVNSTNIASPNVCISPITVVCDGGPVLVEIFTPYLEAPPASGAGVNPLLSYDGAYYKMGIYTTDAATASYAPVTVVRRLTPSAGSHTFGVAAVLSAGANGGFGAGAGTAGGAHAPAYIRVSKIVNQNDGLKPFWTPPVVTQLPSQATVGDQVIYAADATNGVYWTLYYDGLGTYPWKFIGGSPIRAKSEGDVNTASTSYVALGSLSVSSPLPGDYDVTWGSRSWNSVGGNEALMGVSFAGAAVVDNDDTLWNYMSNGTTVAPGGAWHTSRTIRKTGFAGGAIECLHRSRTTGTSWFASRWLSVLPVRVKAA